MNSPPAALRGVASRQSRRACVGLHLAAGLFISENLEKWSIATIWFQLVLASAIGEDVNVEEWYRFTT